MRGLGFKDRGIAGGSGLLVGIKGGSGRLASIAGRSLRLVGIAGGSSQLVTYPPDGGEVEGLSEHDARRDVLLETVPRETRHATTVQSPRAKRPLQRATSMQTWRAEFYQAETRWHTSTCAMARCFAKPLYPTVGTLPRTECHAPRLDLKGILTRG